MKKFTLIIIAVLFTAIVGKSQGLTGEFINFPDSNLLNALIGDNADVNKDGKIDTNEANKKISVVINNFKIKNLTGIEYFKNITVLECDYNNLTSVDLSKNLVLTIFHCSSNQLTSIDISKNVNLTSVWVNFNKLTTVDISNNVNLLELRCNSNQINSVNVAKAVKLSYLFCTNNKLTSLDVSKNSELSILNCSSNNLASIDVTNNLKLSEFTSSINPVKTLNVTNNVNLITLICDSNQLTILDISKNNLLSTLYINNNRNLKSVCVWTLPFPASSVKNFKSTNCSPNLKYVTSCKNLDVNENNNISNTIIVYPNPAKNVINVNYNLGNENIYNDIEEINIYNIVGKKVMVAKQNTDAYKSAINVSDLTPNIYIVEIKTSKQIYRSKFVKE